MPTRDEALTRILEARRNLKKASDKANRWTITFGQTSKESKAAVSEYIEASKEYRNALKDWQNARE